MDPHEAAVPGTLGDARCVAFLQWALPRLGLRWAGFRRVRRQVCKRLQRRMAALGLSEPGYRALLERCPEEWEVLDSLCRISISRFFRDRRVFKQLEREILPGLARTREVIRAWSAGCASGEEPYSLALLWQLRVRPHFPGVSLAIVASDADARLLERAQHALYPASALEEVPAALREAGFERSGERYQLRGAFRQGIEFRCEDLRRAAPEGPFALVLCRNLAFTYFDPPHQREVLVRIRERISPGGVLIVGAHEALPGDAAGLVLSGLGPGIYRRP